MTGDPQDRGAPAPPSRLRVVSGSPTTDELAVLTAVITAATAGGEAPRPRVRRGGWNDPGAQHRRMPVPGPNGWASSLR